MIKNEIGTIESISPQGEIVYAVIRRKGDLANDIEGNIVYINSSICTVDTSYTLIPDENKNLAESEFQDFIEFCNEIGIKVMLDLVIKHTSIDSNLVNEHGVWYKRSKRGNQE